MEQVIENAPAEAKEEPKAAPPTQAAPAEDKAQAQPAEGEAGEQAEDKEGDEGEKKDGKPWYEKALTRKERRIANLTRRLYETQAMLQQQAQGGRLTPAPIEADNRAGTDDSEPVSLPRSELQKLIEQRAREIAPKISEQTAVEQRRQAVIEKLSASLGEKFDDLAEDLDDAFGGLKDGNGRPKPAADAIFEAEDPQALIEYLADPDNAAEAKEFARMNALQAGKHLAKLEAKLQALKAKPQPSKAPTPIEPIKGAGPISNMPSDSDPIDVWVRKERERLAKQRGR